MVIKELLKNKKPSPIAVRDVIPRGRKSECRSMATEGSHQRFSPESVLFHISVNDQGVGEQ